MSPLLQAQAQEGEGPRAMADGRLGAGAWLKAKTAPLAYASGEGTRLEAEAMALGEQSALMGAGVWPRPARGPGLWDPSSSLKWYPI